MRWIPLKFAPLVIWAGSATAGSATPQEVARHLASEGPRAAVRHMYENGEWRVVSDHIKSGEARWVGLAVELSKGTDAATSEDLSNSLVYALPKAPRAVLATLDLTGKSIPRSSHQVCSASFYEGDPTNVRAYRASAIRAVGRISDPALVQAKTECLAQLRRAP
jgi:hypothetical protein